MTQFRTIGDRGPGMVSGSRLTTGMTDTALGTAHRRLEQAADAVCAVAESGGDEELLAVLGLCEGATRRLDRVVVEAVAGLERRGVFTERGYRSAAGALADLLGWERFEARRRVVAAEHVAARAGLDGAPLPARLPATAAVFRAWAGAEQELAAKAARSTRRPSRRPGVQPWSRRWTRTARSPTTAHPPWSTTCT